MYYPASCLLPPNVIAASNSQLDNFVANKARSQLSSIYIHSFGESLRMPPYTISSLKAELNSRGWRLTPQRETILHVFQNLPKGNHLSAEELHDLLEQRGEGISLSTIYRSVKLMARMGILRELELAEGHKHYELNQPHPHDHHHLVCVQCNKTIEFKNDSIRKHSMKQTEKEGFQLIDCQLTVMGVCPEAIRMGWPSALPSNWSCSRAIAESKPSPVEQMVNSSEDEDE